MATPWIMAQSWRQLLFAHWPLPPAALRPLLPPGLELDTFADQAWLGVITFSLADIHLRGVPPMPLLSSFPEVNLRTYVTFRGQPGVLFLSLHCPNRLAMAIARPWFRLPYRYADVRLSRGLDGVAIAAASPRGATVVARYAPLDAPSVAVAGSLDAWLTERYCYYTTTRGGLLARCPIAHPRWQLSPAIATFERLSLADAFGLTLPDTPPLLHYCERMDAQIWPLERVTRPLLCSSSADRSAHSGNAHTMPIAGASSVAAASSGFAPPQRTLGLYEANSPDGLSLPTHACSA
jgi:uncharacterized protein